MRIKILGNGGAVNSGLPYNSFLIDGTTLVETPPDVMLSLHRERIDIISINEIVISHLHGDHSFGLPFLALALFYSAYGKGNIRRVPIFSPSGGKEYFMDLAVMALSAGHPCIRWMEESMDFQTVDEKKSAVISGCRAVFHRMEHFIETYGFVLEKNGRSLFAYTADTLWCASVEEMIRKSPEVILCDMNGEREDAVRVHMGESDLIERACTGGNHWSRYYGTHLKNQKSDNIDAGIRYVYPGMEIVIP